MEIMKNIDHFSENRRDGGSRLPYNNIQSSCVLALMTKLIN